MPTYEYQCPKCGIFTDVTKSVQFLNDSEKCPQCKRTNMNRVIMTPPKINPSGCSFEPHYNWGLGKVVKSKRDVKEELHRIKGETGKEIVEVGNDTLKSIKKKRKEYTLD